MSRIMTLAVALLAALALTACSEQEPEISLEEQVPAEQRDAAAAGTEGEGEPAEGGNGGDGGETAEGEGEGGGGDEVVFQAFDLGFEPETTELPAGDVTLTLDNTGNLPHDITIEELGDETVVETDGGGSESGSVSLEPGTYTFYCSVPGHRSSMEVEVEVTG